MNIDERVTRLEVINEQTLNKIVEGLESVVFLKNEAEENKQFRRHFKDNVKEVVGERLNTIQFEKALKETVEHQILVTFNKPEIREDFEKKVKAIHSQEMKDIMLGLYIKLTVIVGTIATALVTAILKGML